MHGRLALLWLVATGVGLAAPAEVLVDIGSGQDVNLNLAGIHGPENPGQRARHPFYQSCDFRWFGNEWALDLPVYAGRDNLVTMRMKLHGGLVLSLGADSAIRLTGSGDDGYEYQFLIPADAAGLSERVRLSGRADPPVRPAAGDQDPRDRAMTVDWFKVQVAPEPAPVGVPALTAPTERPPLPAGLWHLDIAAPDGSDLPHLLSGAYQPEGPNLRSKSAFFNLHTYRWFDNRFELRVRVAPRRHNLVELYAMAFASRFLRFQVEGGSTGLVTGSGGSPSLVQIPIAAEVIGDRSELTIAFDAVPAASAAGGDARLLAIALAWARSYPVVELPVFEDLMSDLPDTPEPSLSLPRRLRGTESRPLVTDVEAYVMQARLMRCNVMTIGPMNGRHFTAFPTADGVPWPELEADFIPRQVAALREWGIASIGWLPFNVQDLRSPDECEVARKYPQYRMEYIEWDQRSSQNRVGMCVASSPWREIHAGILKEAAATGIDGVFFDGFYLGGIPHPSAPGCVCRYCQEAFRADTGLATPARVDWTDPAFKRWVRWRNHKLLETAYYFRDRMREVNPDLAVTCNYNIWPFASKDWETAIPMWATDDFGTSQHAYTGRADLEWVMMGFKSRVSHDFHPAHSDVWRTSRPAWNYDDSPEDRARHELTMRTFMLTALTYGTTPWHGGHISPLDVGVRVHEAVRQREQFFTTDDLSCVGVLVSQDTHDFWGHIPGTTNLADYQDTILGAWLLLTERHVPFRFVFDNQLADGRLAGYPTLLLPSAAALSDQAAARLREYVAGGGRLVVTGPTGEFDGWGDPRPANALADLTGVTRLAGEPALAWLRQRDQAAAEQLLAALAPDEWPVQVTGPRSLAVNSGWSPGRRQLWVHLFNASAFYPGGDTGFRGLGSDPVYAGDVASDGDIVLGGKVRRVTQPAAGVVVRLPGVNAARVCLGVSGQTVERRADGSYALPPIDIHDVLVVEVE